MLPQKSDPIWSKIILSDKVISLNSLATKMLLTRVKLLIKSDNSPEKLQEAINITYDFFIKNEAIVKNDIEQLIKNLEG